MRRIITSRAIFALIAFVLGLLIQPAPISWRSGPAEDFLHPSLDSGASSADSGQNDQRNQKIFKISSPNPDSTWCLAPFEGGSTWCLAPWGEARAALPPEQVTHREMPELGFDFHYVRRYKPAIDKLVAQAPSILERAQADLGIQEMSTIEVWVLPVVADYFELRQEPNRAPEWAVGLSLSGLSTIILAHGSDRAPDEVMMTFAHELAHVVVDHARADKPVPRWFHEGFAVYLAQEWNAERSERLSRAAAAGRLERFEALSRTFPSHQMGASLAYDQSFHFVRWLKEKYGRDFWARVMTAMREDPALDFEAALGATAGEALPILEAHWREDLESSSTGWSILADETIFFFGAALLFVLAYWSVRRRRRRRLLSLRDDNSDDWSYDRARYPLPGEEREQ